MIVNRDQLTMQSVVGDDGTLQLNRDRSAVATNKKVYLVCEGVPGGIREQVPLEEGELGDERVAVSPETVREMLKNVPRDRRFGGLLEHIDVRASATDVTFESTDGKRKTRKTAKRSDREVNSAPATKLILDTFGRKDVTVMCLNLSRFIDLIAAMDSISDDSSGESPVWVAVSPDGDIALRTVKWKTGQRVLGYMHSYNGADSQIPELSEWERRMKGSTKRENQGILNNRQPPVTQRRRRKQQ